MKRGKPLDHGGAQLKRSPMPPPTSTLKAGCAGLKRGTKPLAAVGQRAKRTGQGKVAPTAQERAWMNAAQAFGCIVCREQHRAHVPAEIHHIKEGDRRRGHLFTLPLCVPHHRGGEGNGPFISRHPWKNRFEAAYGTELELLARLRAALKSDNVAAL